MLRGNKRQPPPQQPIPYAQYYSEKKEESNNNTPAVQEQAKEEPVRNVRGTIVNNYKVGYKDWTFVIKETDVLNIEALESPQDEIMFYAFKKNDLRKVNKLQSQIDQVDSDTNLSNQNNMPDSDSKYNKKGKGRK